MVLFATLVSLSARAADPTAGDYSPQVWISPGIYSQHFDSSKQLRNDNVGLNVEVVFAKNHALMGGSYINRNRARTTFAAYEWRPWHWNAAGLELHAGVALGAFDGYPNYRNGGYFLAPLPLLAIEGRHVGVNLSIIPTIRNRLDGAVAVQFKFRVW